MAPTTLERSVQLSVLDRLFQDEGDAGSWSNPADSVRRQKRAVQRDLEWLLNTRRIAEPAPDELGEVAASVYHYGLRDITSLSGDSATLHRELAAHVREVIEFFEPRLMEIRVEVPEDAGDGRRIRFLIDAFLRMDPSPERVVFDTVLETTSGKFHVSGRGDA